jgi:HK97 family phage major capsid protein/HK97 family phage prohead protease
MGKLDFRTLPNSELNIRDGTDMAVEGYALQFNKPSNPMPFIEYIDPKALDDLDLSKVLLLYSHNYENILARTDAESLNLKVDDVGLFFSAQLPDTQLGHDVYTNVANGNIRGCSFGFHVSDDSWSIGDQGQTIHTILQIDELREITLTTVPAYDETSVTVQRSLENFLKERTTEKMDKEELLKQIAVALGINNSDSTAAKSSESAASSAAKNETRSAASTALASDQSATSASSAASTASSTASNAASTASTATSAQSQVVSTAPNDSDKKTQQRDDELPDDYSENDLAHKGEKKTMAKNLTRAKQDDLEVRSFDKYIRSHGEIRDGVTTNNTEAVIPTQILQIEKEALSPNMLKQYVNRQTVSAPKGTLPVLKKAGSGLVTKEELEKNPELAMTIVGVDYSVNTYAGALPISQEMIDDSAVNITAIAGQYVNDVSAITEQRLIGAVLQKATKKTTVSTADDLKKAYNLDIPTGYDKSFVLSQSMYNVIDLMKDANGRYLLQDSIASASGKTLLGAPVYVVDDDDLGGANGWVGDLKSFVLDAVKREVTVKWQDNDLYAQKLATYLRLDVQKAIDEAGEFLTAAPKA